MRSYMLPRAGMQKTATYAHSNTLCTLNRLRNFWCFRCVQLGHGDPMQKPAHVMCSPVSRSRESNAAMSG